MSCKLSCGIYNKDLYDTSMYITHSEDPVHNDPIVGNKYFHNSQTFLQYDCLTTSTSVIPARYECVFTDCGKQLKLLLLHAPCYIYSVYSEKSHAVNHRKQKKAKKRKVLNAKLIYLGGIFQEQAGNTKPPQRKNFCNKMLSLPVDGIINNAQGNSTRSESTTLLNIYPATEDLPDICQNYW